MSFDMRSVLTVLVVFFTSQLQSMGQQALPPGGLDPRAGRAVSGIPFGVFSIDVPIPPGFSAESVRVLVQDAEDRIFYPAVNVRTIEVVDQPAPDGGRLIGGGALVDRLRNAIRG